ncbi:MAG: hypothetical protein ACOYXT_21900 [Bacteroidota bacterium]
MRHLRVLVVSLLLASTSLLLLAQEKKFLLGSGLTYCSDVHHPGINASLTFKLVGELHAGPDFSVLLTTETMDDGSQVKRKELEYNFNVHYLFDIANAIKAYPLAGLNVSKITVHPEGDLAAKKWVKALNAGAGLEYEWKKFRLFAEFKYVYQLRKYDVTSGILFPL